MTMTTDDQSGAIHRARDSYGDCQSCDFPRGHRTGGIRPYVLADGSPILLCDDCHAVDLDAATPITWYRYGVIRVNAPPPRCAWWAMCDELTDNTRAHPTLGDVPCCLNCSAKVDAIASPTAMIPPILTAIARGTVIA